MFVFYGSLVEHSAAENLCDLLQRHYGEGVGLMWSASVSVDFNDTDDNFIGVHPVVLNIILK